MTLQEQLRSYLDENETSMRALSLNAGLSAKSVSDIMHLQGIKPKRSTLLALEVTTGLDLTSLPEAKTQTYADLISKLQATPREEPSHTTAARMARRLLWLMRHAGWVAETHKVCRREIVTFFERIKPSTVGLSKNSFSTYKSEILSCVDNHARRDRKRSISDIVGPWRDLHQKIRKSDLPLYQKNGCGSFFVFLHDREIPPSDITKDVLQQYYEHRLEHSVKDEAKCRRHVKETATLVTTLAKHSDYSGCGFVALEHPFEDGRDRFNVPNDAIEGLMREFDTAVAPWALGRVSNRGEPIEVFLEHLDSQNQTLTGKKALLRKGRDQRVKTKNSRNDELLRMGFLPSGKRWVEATLGTRRGYVVAAAKALRADSGYLIETVEELCDPDVVANIAVSLHEANEHKSFPSGYVASVLKAIRKIAVGYCQCEAEQAQEISDLISAYETGHKGISRRNRSKLQAFTPERIQQFVCVSDRLIADVQSQAESLKRQQRKKTGRIPRNVEVYDAEMIRDVMAALAHEILLVRAPRSENLTGIRLDWIQWVGSEARIIVPAEKVKMRAASDADFVIPLSCETSKLLSQFIEHLRPRVLIEGDNENPYLFPGQGGRNPQPGMPYAGLLKRLCRRVTQLTGVSINPHLYRHLLGWIWLKKDPGKLDAVRTLLGHKHLQTTIDYYAEIDENLALDKWQEHFDAIKRSSKWAATAA
ncbi:site-specific integrase [Aliiroseovarius sp. CAU 1755]